MYTFRYLHLLSIPPAKQQHPQQARTQMKTMSKGITTAATIMAITQSLIPPPPLITNETQPDPLIL